jgi:hypothetical protein
MAAAAAMALGFAVPAQAVPVSQLGDQAANAKGAGSQVDQVRHRCFWYRGHWRCHHHRHNGYYGYGPGIRREDAGRALVTGVAAVDDEQTHSAEAESAMSRA